MNLGLSPRFRNKIFAENLFTFLKGEENIIDSNEVMFVRDKVPRMRANQIQRLLRDKERQALG